MSDSYKTKCKCGLEMSLHECSETVNDSFIPTPINGNKRKRFIFKRKSSLPAYRCPKCSKLLRKTAVPKELIDKYIWG